MIDDFREILDYYNIDYQIKFGSQELDVLCPFHEGKLTYGSTKYNEGKDTFHCFSCGAHGNMFQFVSQLEGCTLQEAEALLRGDFKEGKKTYNVQIVVGNIERKKKRMLGNIENLQTLEATSLRMLFSIATKHPPHNFVNAWLPVATFLKGATAQASLEEKDILNIYSTFTQQLGNSL